MIDIKDFLISPEKNLLHTTVWSVFRMCYSKVFSPSEIILFRLNDFTSY